MSLSQDLTRFCNAHNIRIRQASPDLLVLDNVPVDARLYSKQTTNLCVIREPASRRFVAWVDPDLHPRRGDAPVARLLSGQTRDDWQLVTHPRPFGSAEEAVRETLVGLNGSWSDEVLPPDSRPLRGELLPFVASLISDVHGRRPLWLRGDTVELATKLFRGTRGLVVLLGPSGAGLTALAVEALCQAVATEDGPVKPPRLIHVHGELVPSESMYPSGTDERARRLLAECLDDPACYLLDNVQWLARAGALPQAALENAVARGLRSIATWQGDVLPLTELLPGLRRRLHVIEVPALERDEVLEILVHEAERCRTEHGVRVEPEALRACLQWSEEAAGGDPGRALALLEAGAALVRGSEDGRLGPDEIAAALATFRYSASLPRQRGE